MAGATASGAKGSAIKANAPTRLAASRPSRRLAPPRPAAAVDAPPPPSPTPLTLTSLVGNDDGGPPRFTSAYDPNVATGERLVRPRPCPVAPPRSAATPSSKRNAPPAPALYKHRTCR